MNKTMTLLQTSTTRELPEQFARAFGEHGRSKAILIVGHSNDAGLQLANDLFCDWGTVGAWLKPFELQFVVLAACEAGKSNAVLDLFEPLTKTLHDVYASPAKLYAPQAAALTVLIGMRLWYQEIGDQTDDRQSAPTDSHGSAMAGFAALTLIPHAKPHLYYWRFLLAFGHTKIQPALKKAPLSVLVKECAGRLSRRELIELRAGRSKPHRKTRELLDSMLRKLDVLR